MTDAHEAQYHLTYNDTVIAPLPSDPDNEFFSLGAYHDQLYNVDSDARHYNSRGGDPCYGDDGRATIGASPTSIIPPAANVANKDFATSRRIEKPDVPLTNTSKSEATRLDYPQDARPDPCLHVHCKDQGTNLGNTVDPAWDTKDGFCPSRDCPARWDFCTSRFAWLNGTMIFVCSVSTALSALFVVLASKGQRYGDFIGNNAEAKLSISAAILWTSVMAKTIEISFVTGFVAFLGQVLSRRAFVNSKSRGVTLSELTMWHWVVQPGTLVAQPEIARYTGLSTLGILTLTGTVLSTLYVTAATALVQPISKESNWNAKTMVGSVQTDFANINAIEGRCPNPTLDEDEGGGTCARLDSAGKSLYSVTQFLANWEDIVSAGQNVSTDQEHRPSWIGVPGASDTTGMFPLCRFETNISPLCSTLYSVAVSGSKVEALCGERADGAAYIDAVPDVPWNPTSVPKTRVSIATWRDIGSDWARALNLDTGMRTGGGNDSLSRMLMLLLLQPEDSNPASFEVKLNPALPSLAETLAIAASDTLLNSLQGAPFVEYWNHTHPSLDEPQTQWFRAKLKSREYASGGVDNASKGWLVVLISTFLLNTIVLVYFIVQPGLVTDVSQPPQLFALAVNSPPARVFAGSCRGGPEGKEYEASWFIGYEGGHVSIEPKSDKDSTLSTHVSDPDRISTYPTAIPASSGIFSAISAAFDRTKLYSNPRIRGRRRGDLASSTDSLRPWRRSRSVPSLQSQYELGDIR